jgi:hypothetical protein
MSILTTKEYGNYKVWLILLVQQLKNEGHIFTDFETDITELQQKKKTYQ